MEDFVKQAFNAQKPELIESLYGDAVEEVGDPYVSVYEETAEGEYNAVALAEAPYAVEHVEDAEGEPGYKLVGQQIVADRPLVAPVKVAYITPAARAKWEREILAAIRKELAKA